MADYTKITDFAVKDSLLTGNPLKLITGTAHDNEYNAIAVAIATKVDETSGTLTNGTLVNTALGTPPSGTLTNCTGLPLAGVTDSTTEALGVGSLELGHATDTTLTRVSAGVVAVEGVNVLTTATGAALAGSASQTFSVAAASSAAHAVRSDQVSSDNSSFPLYTPPTTWTATLTGTTAAPTTPVTTTGIYVKIGKYCLISCTFTNVDTTGATGDLIVTGCPFTAGGTSIQFVGTASINGFGTDPTDGSIISGETTIRMRSNITTVYTPIVAGAGKYLFVTIGFITT